MSGYQIGRRPAAGHGFRRTCEIIALASLVLVSTIAARADQAADDVALTKATISLLAAKDLAEFRNRLDPANGQISDDILRKMSDIVAGQPTSIETISIRGGHSLTNGDGNSHIFLEYALPGKWVVVDAVVRTKDGSKRFTRFFITPNGLPLRQINAFHFFGKGPAQYLFLLLWIAVIALTAFAMFVAFKRRSGWRRWAVPLLMPLGLTPTLAVNWNTGQLWVMEAAVNSSGMTIPFFAVRYPMALFGSNETLVPYIYVSAPLIAVGYLLWYWGWQKKPSEPEPQPTPN